MHPDARFDPADEDLEIPERPTPAHLRPAEIARKLVINTRELPEAFTPDTALADIKEQAAFHLERVPEDRRAEWLWLLAGQIDTWIRAAKLVQAAIEYHQLDDIDRNGDVRFGDHGYRAKPARARKLHDAAALIGWLLDHGGTDALLEAFRLGDDNLRITAVRHLAAQAWEARVRGGDEPDTDEARDAYVQMIEDTFFGWEETGHGGRTLDSIPASKAQWVAKLDHGQRRPRKGNR